MKFAIDKESLLKTVGWMSQLETGEGELFLSVSGNSLSLFSCGSVYSRAVLEVHGGDGAGCSCLVKTALFRKVLSTKTDQTVSLDISGETVTVTDSCGKNRISCLQKKECSFPEKSYKAEVVSHTLSACVNECEHARQKSESGQRSFLTSFYVEIGSDGSTFVLTSDGIRISARGLVTSPAKETLVIPGRPLHAFCSQNKGKTGIRLAEDHSGVMLSGNGIEVYIPLSGEAYSSNILAARKLSGKSLGIARSEDVLATLAQCQIASKYMALTMDGKSITINNSGNVAGMQGFSGTVQAECRINCTPGPVYLNVSYVQEAVASLSSDQCRIAIDGPERPVVITDAEEGATEIICARKADVSQDVQ